MCVCVCVRVCVCVCVLNKPMCCNLPRGIVTRDHVTYTTLPFLDYCSIYLLRAAFPTRLMLIPFHRQIAPKAIA